MTFKAGMVILYIYQGVHSWTNGKEFIEPVPVKCKILEINKQKETTYAPFFSIKLDCTEGIEMASDPQHGIGLVKDHPLNKKIIWTDERNVYGIR